MGRKRKQKPTATDRFLHSTLESAAKKRRKLKRLNPRPEPKPPKRHSESHPPPWLPTPYNPQNSHRASFESVLESEVSLVLRYLTPTARETAIRLQTVAKYQTIVSNRFPEMSTFAFGSTGTGLNLPWSDIDLIIVSPESTDAPKQGTQSSKLSKLLPSLKTARLCYSVQILKKAKVPILKIVDADTRLSIDVCYNVIRGYLAVDHVKHWIQVVPGLKDLVLLVKLCVSSVGLSEVYHGGIGGYSIVALCLAFLTRPRGTKSDKLPTSQVFETRSAIKPLCEWRPNPGKLFLEFCTYFGAFPYTTTGIAFSPPDSPSSLPTPYFYLKESPAAPILADTTQSRRPLLTLHDPLNSCVDLTRGTSKIRQVLEAFACVSIDIHSKWVEIQNQLNENVPPINKSLLSKTLYVSKENERLRSAFDTTISLNIPDTVHSNTIALSSASDIDLSISDNQQSALESVYLLSAIMTDENLDQISDASASPTIRNPQFQPESPIDSALFTIDTKPFTAAAVTTISNNFPTSNSLPSASVHTQPNRRTGFNGRDNRTSSTKLKQPTSKPKPNQKKCVSKPKNYNNDLNLTQSRSKGFHQLRKMKRCDTNLPKHDHQVQRQRFNAVGDMNFSNKRHQPRKKREKWDNELDFVRF